MGFVKDAVRDFTDTVGLTDYEGQERAAAQAQQAADRSYSLTREEIDFQREQYGEWKEIYGDLQEDLGEYYKNITGNQITAEQLRSIEVEEAKALELVTKELAQRGITASGTEAQAVTDILSTSAEMKADIRSKADEVAAMKKMQFLGLGLGQGTEMLGVQAGVSSSGAATQGSQASAFGSIAQKYSAQNISSMQDLAAAGIKASGFGG